MIKKQVWLELSEIDEGEGEVVINQEHSSTIDHGKIYKKIAEIGEQKSEEKLLGEIMFGQDTVKITSKHIILLDNDMKIKQIFENRNVCNFIYADKVWVYALNNRRIGYDNKLKKQGGAVINPGLCVYDFSRLLEGNLEVHQLSEALVGSNSFIDYNKLT